MGHYAADFMCDKCGKLRCKCASSPSTDDEKWIVDITNNYEVIQVKEHDKKYALNQTKYGYVDGMPMFRRCKYQHFNTQEEAQTHAVKLLDSKIEQCEEEIRRLINLRSKM